MHFKEIFVGLKEKELVGEYSNCEFKDCVFVGTDFRGSKFLNCKFTNCEIILIKNENVYFENNSFIKCKLKGIGFFRFSKERLSFSFENCDLKQCRFVGLKLQKIKFISSKFEDCEVEDSDLGESNFRESKFKDSIFNNCNLEKANFLHATGFNINPTTNKLKGARFSKDELFGLVREFGVKVGGK